MEHRWALAGKLHAFLTFKIGREKCLDILGVQDMICPGTNQEILAKIVPWLVVFGDGTQKSKQMAVSIGLPELDYPVNAQWPALGQLWGQLASVSATVGDVGLSPVFESVQVTQYKWTNRVDDAHMVV